MRCLLPAFCLPVVLLCACPTGAPEAGPCCTVDEIAKMKEGGVSDDIVMTTVRAGRKPALGADDVIRLKAAGLGDAAMAELLGAATATVSPSPQATASGPIPGTPDPAVAATPTPSAEPTPPPPPKLKITAEYAFGDGSVLLRNVGGQDYSRLVLTANGEYVYRLPVPLKSDGDDRVKLSSFRSERTGRKLDDEIGIKRLHVSADQGVWSRSF